MQHSGYWTGTKFLQEVNRSGETVFYDSVTGERTMRALLLRGGLSCSCLMG